MKNNRPSLESRGRFWWKKEWYSICSGHEPDETKDTCPRCLTGTWVNVWSHFFGHIFYTLLPSVWRWWVNLEFNKKRILTLEVRKNK